MLKYFFRYIYELSVRRRLSALADKTLLNLHDFIILHIIEKNDFTGVAQLPVNQ